MKAVDFFCGGGGMTEGLKMAGIQVLAGVDLDADCEKTYSCNHPDSIYIKEDISTLGEKKLSKLIHKNTGVKIKKREDDLIFVGCSPCQYWSILKTDKSKSEKSKNLILDFQRFVEYYLPGYVVIENVPGLATKSISPLQEFIRNIKKIGYNFIDSDIVKVQDYDVPQSRKRFILLASRCREVRLPVAPATEPNYKIPTVREFIGDTSVFPIVEAGNRDESDFNHTVAGLRKVSLDRLELTPKNGGSRDSWANTNLQIEAYKKQKNNSNFGFKDVYGRMSWDKPGPTITTKFFGISHGRFGHPEQNRAISIREGATLQTFPTNYKFCGTSIASISRQIGNAVPVNLSYHIGLAINKSQRKK